MLEVIVKAQGDQAHLVVRGEVTGADEFPQLSIKQPTVIVIDASEVKYMNSAGIRCWMLWMRDIDSAFPAAKLVFERISYVLVKHITSISDFIPGRSAIQSFEMPFYCEGCDLDFFSWKSTDQMGSGPMKCPKCGKPAETIPQSNSIINSMKQHSVKN